MAGARVLVTGAGVTGRAVVAALQPLGVHPVVCDDNARSLRLFVEQGVEVTDMGAAVAGIADYALVVTSPGFPPTAPVLAAATVAAVPVWGDVELAWRLDASGIYGPPRRWLVVTGTNGKTTTTSMLHAMLTAAGRRSALCGNIGTPVLEVLTQPVDVLAVELSSFQLFWSSSLRPTAGVVLNVAEDHLDWHGDLARYTAAKARALDGQIAVVGLEDAAAKRLLKTAAAPVRVGFRLGEPTAGELGVRDGVLVDRAFQDEAAKAALPQGLPLAPVDSIRVAGSVGVLNALAAAALARAVDVPASAIAAALAAFQVVGHRAEVVAVVDGVTYVDDSKATNPHAAEASLAAYPRVVWLAGGILKGASVDGMVARVADRLGGAVLIGRDRAAIGEALAAHAPDVPVVEVVPRAAGSTGAEVMAEAVAAARALAAPGDTVLLAPAGASFDQFPGYAARGDAFAAAVRGAAID